MAGTGFKLSLSSAKTKSNLKPGRGLNPPPTKRARLSALDDDEPEDDNGGKHEITGFDETAGGAVQLNGKTKQEEEDEKAKKTLVIPMPPQKNWIEERLKKLRGTNTEKDLDEMEKPKLSNGLHIFPKKGEEGAAEENEAAAQDAPKDEPPPPTTTTLTAEERLEKDALAALITGETPDHTVIPLAGAEHEASEQDYREDRPAPTVADYEAMPIEGFGAALLRGMGWKGDEELGNTSANSNNKTKKLAPPPKEVKARPALLGIGAKPEAAVGLDDGAKGKSAARQARDALNKPIALGVTLRNKKTGEYITEEELKKKLEMQKMVDAEGGDGESSRRRRGKYDDDREDEYQRSKGRDRDRERERDRRDDRYASDRDRERRREKDRDRERDRDRRDRDRDRDYDSSSRRKDYGSSSRRDERDRDRDRDREKERDRRHRRRGDSRERERERDRGEDGHRDRDRDRDRKRRREYDD